MKFLADECCDAGLVNSLREAGHDVAYILEKKTGIADEEVLAEAYRDEIYAVKLKQILPHEHNALYDLNDIIYSSFKL